VRPCRGLPLAAALALLAGCALERYEPAPLAPAVAPAPASLEADPRIRAALEASGLAPASWPPQRWDLAMLVAAAIAVHPALGEQQGRIALAEAEIITAGRRPVPRLTTPGEYHSRQEDEDDGHWGIGLGLSFVLQARGSREAGVAAAEAERRAAALELRERAWRIRMQVRRAWSAMSAASTRAALLERAAALARDQVLLVAARVAAGEASGLELGRARLEAQRLALGAARQDVALLSARTALAAAIGVRLGAVPAQRLALALPEAPPPLPAAGDRQREALTGRPDMQAALARYAAAEARLERAVARQLPDVQLSPSYFFEQGDNIWQLATAMPLPLPRRNAGPIATARAERELRAAELRSLQTRVVAALEAASEHVAVVSEALDRAEALLQRARDHETATEGQVEAGYADHLGLLQAQRQRIDAELAVLELEHSRYAAIGELEDALRRPLDGGVYAEVLDVRRAR